MTTHSHTLRFIGLLAAVFLLSGCVFLDRLKQQGLAPPPPGQGQQMTEQEQKSTLLADTLHFAGRIHHLPEQNRNRIAMTLRRQQKIAASPRNSLELALIALYVDEDTLPTTEALAALDNTEKAISGNDLKLLGLVDVLRQALLEIEGGKRHVQELTEKIKQQDKELAKNLQTIKDEKIDALEAELLAAKKKNQEMALQLKKLLEIEKIVDKRK